MKKQIITMPFWFLTLGLWGFVFLPNILPKQTILQKIHLLLPQNIALCSIQLVITVLIVAIALFPQYYAFHEENYPIIRKILLLLLIFIYYLNGIVWLLIYSRGSSAITFEKLFGGGLGFFICLIACFMPKLPRNRIVGIRFSWTMSNDEVWKITQYYSAIEAMITGILLIMLSFFAPYKHINLLFIIIVVISIWTIYSAIHSYFVAQKIHSDKNSLPKD